jgi:hypothetical protein
MNLAFFSFGGISEILFDLVFEGFQFFRINLETPAGKMMTAHFL